MIDGNDAYSSVIHEMADGDSACSLMLNGAGVAGVSATQTITLFGITKLHGSEVVGWSFGAVLCIHSSPQASTTKEIDVTDEGG